MGCTAIGIVGIDTHRSAAVQLQDAVERRHGVAAIVRLTLRWASSVESAKQRSGFSGESASAVVIDQVACSVILMIANLSGADGLEIIRKHHACQSQQSQPFVSAVLHIPESRLFLSERFEFCFLCQFYVQRDSVAWFVLVNLTRMVVAHDLDLSHHVGTHVASGKVVLAAKHVKAFNIER